MRIVQIYKADLLNGVGLRNVYFFSGCEHHCPGCFNKITWDYEAPNSHDWTEGDFRQLIKDSELDYISGITLSGGDPLSHWNREGILELCKKYKEYFGERKTIWLYTGFTWEAIMEFPEGDPRKEVLKYIDVICEGPFVESQKSPKKPWVGSENQRVINVKESLVKKEIVLL